MTDDDAPCDVQLSGRLSEYRSAHVGIAYRVLVRVDREKRTVCVARIAHRAEVYRPL